MQILGNKKSIFDNLKKHADLKLQTRESELAFFQISRTREN